MNDPKNATPLRISKNASVRRNPPPKERAARKQREAEGSVLNMDMIRQRLHNPTRVVTEAELAAEYSYVIKDLRSIGLLALALVVVLVLLAQFI